MPKLNLIAKALNKNQKLTLIDQSGRQIQVILLGTNDKELILRDAKITGRSKTILALKRYQILERALVAVSMLRIFR